MLRVTIHGYGLSEGRRITGTVTSKNPNVIRVKVPAFGKPTTWSFNPGTGQQIGFPISGYRILREDLQRIREHDKTL